MKVSSNTKVILYRSLILAALIALLLPIHAHAMEPIFKVLQNTSTGEGATVSAVWKDIMAFVNGFGIAVLIAVAFSQILRINVNTYGVKKILPAMILAIIAANFSYLFCRIIIDIANVVSSKIIDGSSAVGGFTDLFKTGSEAELGRIGAPSPTGNIFWFIIGQLLVIIGGIMIYMLAYLMLVRNWVIYFLVALSPLAMMAIILPQTKTIFNQWWSNYIKWAFMPVVSLFWIWFGTRWYMNIGDGVFLLNYAYAAVCFYLALTTPFKMGGAIMNTWGNWGKKAWGATAGNAWKYTGGAAINDYKELARLRMGNWYQRQGANGSGLNPIARMARSGAARRMTIDEEKKAQGNIRDDLEGTILKNDARLRRRINMNRSLGGGKALREAELEAEYLSTERGEAWSKGRKEYLVQLETAQNRTKHLHGKQDLDFITAKGDWGKLGTEGYQLRQDFLDIQSAMDLRQAQVKKSTDDERLRAYVTRLDAMKRNDDVASFMNIQNLNSRIAEANTKGDTKLVDSLTIERDKITERIKRERGLSDAEFTDLLDNAETNYNSRLAEVQKNMEKFRDPTSRKLIIPYEMRVAYKLNEDETEVIGLNDMGSLGPAGASRINALAASAMMDDSKGYNDKYSIKEIANLLKLGEPGVFKREEVDMVLSGQGHKVDPLTRAKITDAWRAFWTGKRSRPGSVEATEFAENMAELLPENSLGFYVDRIQTDLKEEYQRQKPTATEAQMDKDFTDNGLLYTGDGSVTSQREYINRVLVSRGVKGVNARNLATSRLDQDRIFGSSRPINSAFGGEGLGNSVIDNPSVNMDFVADQLNTQLVNATNKQLSAISKSIQEGASKVGVSSEEVFRQSFNKIHQAKRDMVDGFARDIGLLGKQGALTPLDREMMLGMMTKMRGKNKEQIETEVTQTFKGKYNATQPGSIKLPANITQEHIEQRSAQAGNIQTAIRNADKIEYVERVKEISPYISGLQVVLQNPEIKGNPSEKMASFSSKSRQALDSISSSDKLTPQILSSVKEVLKMAGRTNDQINDIISSKEKAESILFSTTMAAESAAKSIDENGNINQDKAEGHLFDHFADLNKSKRIGGVI